MCLNDFSKRYKSESKTMTQKPPVPPPKPSLHLNWEDWLPFLENQDIPEAQKKELIETLWSIVIAFVDLGWDVGEKPASSAESCGQTRDLTSALRAGIVYSEDTPKEQ